jgi:hypothetical protein
MNNEPVAWMNKDDSGLSFKNHGGGWQPLYTHPAKTLTDEEIIEVWGNIEETFNEEYDAKVFARAILRKAQEK